MRRKRKSGGSRPKKQSSGGMKLFHKSLNGLRNQLRLMSSTEMRLEVCFKTNSRSLQSRLLKPLDKSSANPSILLDQRSIMPSNKSLMLSATRLNRSKRKLRILSLISGTRLRKLSVISTIGSIMSKMVSMTSKTSSATTPLMILKPLIS